MPIALEGLRTVIYPSPDLDAAKTWWTGFLGFGPYFDEPFYVGYNVGGYEPRGEQGFPLDRSSRTGRATSPF